jgi:hypothetical protein
VAENGRANLHPAPPFEPDNEAAVRHGAHSDKRVSPRAATHKRRVLRQIGLRASDLDGIALGYLDGFSRAQAKIELLDAYADANGFIDRRGKPRGFAAVYVSLLNSARLSLSRLDEHLKKRGDPRVPSLEQYLARRDSA